MPPSLTPEELASSAGASPEENDASEAEAEVNVSENDRETKDQIAIHQAITVREPKVAAIAVSDAQEALDVHAAEHDEVKETTLPSTASTVAREEPEEPKPASAKPIKAAAKEEPREEPKPASAKPIKAAAKEEPREEPKPASAKPAPNEDIDDEVAFASRALGEAVTLRVERGKLSEEPKPKVEVEEPAKAETKIEAREEPKPAAKSRAKTDDKAESSASHSSPSLSSKRRGEGKPSRDAADRSSPSHRSPSGELETDMSSVSAEFFRKDTDSLPPFIDSQEHHLEGAHDEEEPLVDPLTPTALARRARLRRVVAGVVAFAGVISLAVVGKSIAGSRRSSQVAPPPTVVEAKTNEAPKPIETAKLDKKPDDAKPADSAKPEGTAKPADSAKAEGSAKPEGTAKPEDAKPADTAKPDAPKPSGGDGVALRKEAEKLLNQGRNKDAVEKAREAIAADPSEAMGYLLHGSALQAMGKWKDGVDSYSECVRNATKGPVHECRAMGGRK